jgi:capsular exopolysaccharide synthesis family protein
MTDSVLRRYLEILRREWWVILQAVVVVALAAGFLADRQHPSTYYAGAQLYVEPVVGADGTIPVITQPTFLSDTTVPISGVLAQSLARQAASPAVLEGAAKKLGANNAAALGDRVATTVNLASRTIGITASAGTPDGSIALANAVAQSLVDVRWATRERALVAQITATATSLGNIQNQISRIGAQEANQPTGTAATSAFETAKAVWLTQYQTTFATEQQLQGALASRDNGVLFLLPAQIAQQSKPVDTTSRALEGAAIGLVLGIGLAALRETLDTKVRHRERAEALTDLRTLGELPKDRVVAKQPLAVIDAPWSRYAETVRALRASVVWTGPDRASATIAVTSPESGDGKTTLAVNLAAAFALAGLKTVLVSADFRHPTTHATLVGARRAFGMPTRGFAELLLDDGFELTDPLTLDAALVTTRVENLWWLPSSASTPLPVLSTNAAVLLGSPRARQLLDMLSGEAEMVVIDTPPALLSDAASLNRIADGVVLVVDVTRTHRTALVRTVRSWKGVPVRPLGLVLNRTRSTRDDVFAGAAGGSRRSRRAASRATTMRSIASTQPKPSENGNRNGNGHGHGNGARPVDVTPGRYGTT